MKNSVRPFFCAVAVVLMLNASLVFAIAAPDAEAPGADKISVVEFPSYPRVLELPEGTIKIQMPQFNHGSVMNA